MKDETPELKVVDFVTMRQEREKDFLVEQLIGMAATTGFAVGVAATFMLWLIYDRRS